MTNSAIKVYIDKLMKSLYTMPDLFFTLSYHFRLSSLLLPVSLPLITEQLLVFLHCVCNKAQGT